MNKEELAWEAPRWYWDQYVAPKYAEEEVIEGDEFVFRYFGHFLLIENSILKWRALLWDRDLPGIMETISKAPSFREEGKESDAYRYIIEKLYPGKELLSPFAPLLYFRDDSDWLKSAASELTSLLLFSFVSFINARLREAGFIPTPIHLGTRVELLREREEENHKLFNAFAKALSSIKFKIKVADEEITLVYDEKKSFSYSGLKAAIFSEKDFDGSLDGALKVVLTSFDNLSNIDFTVDDINNYLVSRFHEIVKNQAPKSLEPRNFDVELSRFFKTSIAGKLYRGFTLPVSYWGPDGIREEVLWFYYLLLDDVIVKINDQRLYVGRIDNFALSERDLTSAGIRIAIKNNIFDIRKSTINIAAINSYLKEVGA